MSFSLPHVLLALSLVAGFSSLAKPLHEASFMADIGASGAPNGWGIYPGKPGHPVRSGSLELVEEGLLLRDNGHGEIGFFKDFTVSPSSYLRASVEARLFDEGTKISPVYLQFTFRKPSRSYATQIIAGETFRETANVIQVPKRTNKVRIYIYSHKAEEGEVILRNFKLEESDAPIIEPLRPIPPNGQVVIEAELAQVNPQQAAIVRQASFASKRGVSLKADATENNGLEASAAPDLVFDVESEVPGRFVLQTHAATDTFGTALMKKANSKHHSMFAKFQIDEQQPTRRVIFVPWSRPGACRQTTGKFRFNGQKQKLKIWLPKGLVLDHIKLITYRPPAVPEAVQTYRPSIVPPAAHPRILVTPESLPQVRRNLELGENRPIWETLKERAVKPFAFAPTAGVEISYRADLEKVTVEKAFYYLMANDEAIGKEAIRLTKDYLELVEFGNLLDITREIGRAIFAASRVYDWCYAVMSEEERDSIRRNLLRLSDDMECGWPPFRQAIVNGHGNEAQICRDLFSMGIAIYSEDPQPYQYCSYKILEELIPMRAMEYESPRHNQGLSYGAYRFAWDMHAAWILRRMTGREVFKPNIKNVHKFWLYTRTPDGSMFVDGDAGRPGGYWKYQLTALLCSSYAADPIMKGEFNRQGGLPYDPVLVLLLNDPALKAEKSLASLPTTIDFGPILGGMSARTGWNIGTVSSEVAVSIRGGGYHFGNHQHEEAGAFQLYYRGLQVADLGLYKFYGTPYDSYFNKRSVSHSMMLIRDPQVKGLEGKDGGTRLARRCPLSPEAAEDAKHDYGTVLACSFGPSQQRPFYNYFSADLTNAYGERLDNYTRSFCFLNLDSPQRPAALIVLDHLKTTHPEAQKIWQINTLNTPELTGTGAILSNSLNGLVGKVHLNMLRPAPAQRSAEVLSGTDSTNVFGKQYEAPSKALESKGSRLMFQPKRAQANETFLTVLQMVSGDEAPLPVREIAADGIIGVVFGDRVVGMSATAQVVDRKFILEIPHGETYQILFAGLKPGSWSVEGAAETFNAKVAPGKQTIFFLGKGGTYRVSPSAIGGAERLETDADFVPEYEDKVLENQILIKGQSVSGMQVKRVKEEYLLPCMAVVKALGGSIVNADPTLKIQYLDHTIEFGSNPVKILFDGTPIPFKGSFLRKNGEWFLPDFLVAGLLGYIAERDKINGNVFLKKRDGQSGADNILWFEASDPTTVDELFATLDGDLGKRGYWAGAGRKAWFVATMRQPIKLQGVGIRWLRGSTRVAKFALEISEDGDQWSTVFDGKSSGKDGGMENYMFEPAKMRKLRFRGYGNNQNSWNSILNLTLFEK